MSGQPNWHLEDFATPQELHPDLRPHVHETASGLMVLAHPLIHQVPYSPEFNNLVNRQYAYRVRELEQAYKGHEWERCVFLHDRPYRLDAFLTVEKHIKDATAYWQLVRALYTDTENFHPRRDQWRDLLLHPRMADPCRMMNKAEQERLEAMPERFTVYRGVSREGDLGFAWTASLSVAMEEGPTVYRATVEKGGVIAYFAAREEQEVLVNPDLLEDVAQMDLTQEGE